MHLTTRRSQRDQVQFFNRLLSLVGHLFLHGGFFHVLGNMVFLWVFGNAVCAKLGNLWYVPAYLGLGILAALTHLAFDGAPAIGASGAINGIVGTFVVFYPLNEISCFTIFLLRVFKFSVSSYWLVLFWLVFDIIGAAFLAEGGVAYAAHIGGLAAGVAAGLLLLKLDVLRENKFEMSLRQILKL